MLKSDSILGNVLTRSQPAPNSISIEQDHQVFNKEGTRVSCPGRNRWGAQVVSESTGPFYRRQTTPRRHGADGKESYHFGSRKNEDVHFGAWRERTGLRSGGNITFIPTFLYYRLPGSIAKVVRTEQFQIVNGTMTTIHS